MERKIIERAKTGQYVRELEGMQDFAEKVAKELCEKYPDVDFFDLESMFDGHFRFAMAMELMEYGSERCENKE